MIPNPNEKFVKLTTEYDKRKITMQQLESECAYWFLDLFHEVNHRPYPSTPREYQEFLNLGIEKRLKVSAETHSHPVVKAYLDEKMQIKNQNYSNLHKLKEFREFVPKEDFVSRQKYTDKINQFEDRMLNVGGI